VDHFRRTVEVIGMIGVSETNGASRIQWTTTQEALRYKVMSKLHA
jgi:hypothetical protein